MKKSNLTQEQKGLAKVHSVCAQMDAVWRPTPGTDIGVDGQIEFLEIGTAVSTGHIVAAQIKSGKSYFKSRDRINIKYYPSKKHRRYWERLNLPVILILHDPDNDLTIYVRVKPQIKNEGPLLVPKDQVFSPQARPELLIAAKNDVELMPPAKILDGLKGVTLNLSEGHDITGIEFLLACTNPRSEYFELRMCRITTLIGLASPERYISINSDTYEFILRCTLKCWASKLTESFEREFEEFWYGLKMVPDIAVPLTAIGLDVLGHLWSRLDTYLSIETFSHLGCSDSRALATIISDNAQAESSKLDASDRLGEVPR